MSECCVKWAIFKLYYGENKLHFNDMMMSALDQINTLSWLFIVVAHLEQPWVYMSLHLYTLNLILNQPVCSGIHVASLIHIKPDSEPTSLLWYTCRFTWTH
jgi:hypothetical protein